MSITKLNESSLRALGFDQPTVKALAHLLRQVGTTPGGATLPDVAMQAENTAISVNQLAIELAGALEALALMMTRPADVLPTAQDDLAPVALAAVERDDLTPVAQLAAMVEYLQTEVRHLADQQVVNYNLIQELRQGTML